MATKLFSFALLSLSLLIVGLFLWLMSDSNQTSPNLITITEQDVTLMEDVSTQELAQEPVINTDITEKVIKAETGSNKETKKGKTPEEIEAFKAQLKAKKALRLAENKKMKEDAKIREDEIMQDIKFELNRYKNAQSSKINKIRSGEKVPKDIFLELNIEFGDPITNEQADKIFKDAHWVTESFEADITNFSYYWKEDSIFINLNQAGGMLEVDAPYYEDPDLIIRTLSHELIIHSEEIISWSNEFEIYWEELKLVFNYHNLYGVDAVGLGYGLNTFIDYNPNLTALDSTLKNCLTSGLNKYNGVITEEDISSIIVLRCKNVNNLKVIKNWKNLKGLEITVNDMESLDGLDQLQSLEYLNINAPEFDMESIRGLSNLQVLVLKNSNIKNIDIISNFTNLTSLYLDGSKFEGFDFLSMLENLEHVSFNNLGLTKIPDITNKKKIRSLNLVSNKLVDVSSITQFINIGSLNLGDNEISALPDLSMLEDLYFLSVTRNYITCDFFDELRKRHSFECVD